MAADGDKSPSPDSFPPVASPGHSKPAPGPDLASVFASTSEPPSPRCDRDPEKEPGKGTDPGFDNPGLPAPGTASGPVIQKWNYPRRNMARVAACYWGYVVTGLFDGSYGALVHYIDRYYSLNYVVVSLIFLCPFAGYTAAALLCNAVHARIGQRGIGLVSGGTHLVAAIMLALHPPYPVLVIAYLIAGFGNGLINAAWDAYLVGFARKNELLGFLHASYGFGCLISPIIATSMITEAGLMWYVFYFVVAGTAVAELAFSLSAFWTATAARHHESVAQHDITYEVGTDAPPKSAIRQALLQRPFARITWQFSVFIFCGVGLEVAMAGWIVVFMLQERGGEDFASGMTATGFWLGLTIGRILLGFVTPRIGERIAVAAYLAAILALELVFWLVPHFLASAVAAGFQGLFVGQLFPASIAVMSGLLPRRLHVSAIGFAAALGGGGGALMPFVVGAIAQARGVGVLPPVVLVLGTVCLALWLTVPWRKKNESEGESERGGVEVR